MSELAYLTAAIPKTFTILGQRLEPFSLGHMMWLRRLENGFVSKADRLEAADLLIAVFVCCQKWEEIERSFADPKLEEKIEAWGEQIGFFDLEQKAAEFMEYLMEGSSQPELLPPEGDPRAAGASFIQMLHLFLVEKLRIDPAAALDYPFGLAKHNFFAWHEQHGSARIVNEEEGASMDEAHSDEMLARCLAALPGSVPLRPEGTVPEPARNPGRAKRRKKGS